MTLHEAIKKILEEHGEPLTISELAKEVNERKLFVRKDGNHIPSTQISSRITKYPNLFHFDDQRRVKLRKRDYSTSTNISDETEQDYIIEKTFQELETLLYITGLSSEKIIMVMTSLLLIGKLCHQYPQKYSLIPSESSEGSPDFYEFRKLINRINKAPAYLDTLDPVIDNINLIENTYAPIYDILFALSSQEVDNETFTRVFNKTLQAYYSNNSKGTEFSSPRIISSVIKIIVGDKSNLSVYDPAAGAGGFFISLLQNLDIRYCHAQESNEDIFKLLKLNFLLNGISCSNISNSDSLNNPMNVKTDLVVCDPPFSIRYSPVNRNYKAPSFDGTLGFKKLDDISRFIEICVKSLNENGIGIIIVPDNFLLSEKTKAIKQFLVENNLIEYVISLPPKAFGTKSNVTGSILYLKKNGTSQGVNFISISESALLKARKFDIEDLHQKYLDDLQYFIKGDFYEFKWANFKVFSLAAASTDHIRRKQYVLLPRRYVNDIFLRISELQQSGANFKYLSDCITPCTFKSVDTSRDKNVAHFPYITVKDLCDSDQDFYLDIQNITPILPKNNQGKLVDRTVLLLARIGRKIKPTVFNFNGTPIIINNNIVALCPNLKRVDLEYLIVQLNSGLVEEQLDTYNTGNTIPYYRTKDIMSLFIEYKDTLLEQLKYVNEYKRRKSEKSQLIQFINQINLVSSNEELKKELERFSKNYFSNSTFIEFKFILDFNQNPFSVKDIQEGKLIKNSKDGFSQHLMLVDSDQKVIGIITVDTSSTITYQTYSEINTYAVFLKTLSEAVGRSAARQELATFAHTSKGLLFDLKKYTDELLSNANLKILLGKHFVKDQRFIERRIQRDRAKQEEFTALSSLINLDNSISRIGEFYRTLDERFKQLRYSNIEPVDIIALIKKNPSVNSNVTIICESKISMVFIKAEAINSSLADLISNALKYSEDGTCTVEVIDSIGTISIEIKNKSYLTLSKSHFDNLGKSWFKKDPNDPSISSGIYWAFQSIEDSGGSIAICPFEEYIENRQFTVNIKFRKQ